MTVVSMVLISTGTFFLVTGLIGLIRLPDLYTRAHAVGKTESLGILLVLIGLGVHEGLTLKILQIIVIILFAVTSNTTALLVIMRVARRREDPREVEPGT